MNKFDLITLGLAIWGAVIATATWIWKICTDVVHRGKLKVRCELQRIIDPVDERSFDNNKLMLAYHVTNIGKEPVWVNFIGGSIKGKLNRFKSMDFNEFKLEPTQQITKLVPSLILDENVKSLEVIDTLGRCYKCPRKWVKRLLKEHTKLKSND